MIGAVACGGPNSPARDAARNPYPSLIEARSRRKAASFAAGSGPRRQAVTPKPGNGTHSSRSPPISLHGPSADTATGTGDGLGPLSTADPPNVTRMPSGGSAAIGFRHCACRKTDGQGSVMAALLRNRRGPTGAVQTRGTTRCQLSGVTNDRPPTCCVTSAAAVGDGVGAAVGDGSGDLVGIGTETGEQAARRMRLTAPMWRSFMWRSPKVQSADTSHRRLNGDRSSILHEAGRPAMVRDFVGKHYRSILAAALIHAQENNCPCIFMNVISLRHELIAWYRRHGYHLTGETKPLPDDNRFGVPTQPIEFVIMEKML